MNVFHNLLNIEGMPDLAAHGIRAQRICGRYNFSRPGAPGFNENAYHEPDEEATRKTARETMAAGQLLTADIEHWHLYEGTDAEIEANLDKLMRVMDWLHDEEPGLRCGYYGELPTRDWWSIVSHKRNPTDPGARTAYKDWKKRNARIRKGRDEDTGRYSARGLADCVDVVMPSLYTMRDDPDGWVLFAKGMIREARKYQKSVLPYLWPLYHQNAKNNTALIPHDLFKLQLETVLKHADGVIIWGWGGNANLKTWSDDWGWWQATKEVISGL